MSRPDSDDTERKYWPPPIWSAKKKKVGAPPADPPIVKRVTLPDSVTIRHLAEITGSDVSRVVEELKRWRLFVPYNRSLDFEAAARFLRKYGIGADREEV